MSKDKPNPTTTMDSITSEAQSTDAAKKNPRFLPSQITAEGFTDSRIRMLEPYQAKALRVFLASKDISSASQISASDESLVDGLSKFLCACLVGPERKNVVPQLKCRGRRGQRRLEEEVKDTEIVRAITVAIEQAGVFDIQLERKRKR